METNSKYRKSTFYRLRGGYIVQLDFTAIRGEAVDRPTMALTGTDSIKAPVEQKTAYRATETPTAGRLVNLYIQEQAEHERTLRVYRDYQKNIKESEKLRTDILRGSKAGEPPISLLLKASECISLMTGDTVFYNQFEGNIKSIYGAGLLEPEPLKKELGEVQERLQNLQKALERNTEPEDSKRRIKGAIEAHISRANQLQTLLQKEPQL